MKRHRWTLRSRLLAGFGLTIVALLAAGGVALATVDALQREMHESVTDLTEVSGLLFQSHDATLRYVALAQSDLLGAQIDRREIERLSGLADSVRREMVSGVALATAEERAGLERLGALQARVEVRLAVAQAYQDVGRGSDASRQAAAATAVLDTLFVQGAALHAGQEMRAARSLAGIDALVRLRYLMLSFFLLLGLGAAGLFGWLTWRAIVRPVDRLLVAARTIGRGDLRVTVDRTGLDREYEVLAGAFTTMADRLHTLVTAIQAEAFEVSTAADGLTSASDQSASATGMIGEVTAEIAREADSQRTHLRDAETLIGKVGASASQLSETAVRSRELATEIGSSADQARTDIEEALQALARAREVIAGSGEEIGRLQTASESVDQFVTAVHEIANQTNLLALNAAIEAARAGEHGRGFAIVADEVRKLAGKAGAAATEITEVVGGMRAQMVAASAAFQSGVKDLGDVRAVSSNASNSLSVIDEAVDRVREISESIYREAERGQRSVQSLGEHLEHTRDGTEAQAAASEEAAAAAEQTVATAEEVAATAQQLAASAGRLERLVAAFDLDGAQAADPEAAMTLLAPPIFGTAGVPAEPVATRDSTPAAPSAT